MEANVHNVDIWGSPNGLMPLTVSISLDASRGNGGMTHGHCIRVRR